MICHCLRYIFVPFRFFVIRHWCSTSPWFVRCCSYRCCWVNTAVLQRVRAAKVVHQVRGINVTSLGRDDGLAYFADDIGLTTVRLIISKKLPYTRADFSSQFPCSLRHSFSAYEKESSRPARDNDMAQPNMILLHDWLLACHSLCC